MNAFPLVARALASSARSGAVLSLRFLAGGGSMALVILTLLATDGDGGASGRWLFNALSWGAMAGLGLLAVFNTADAISRERREETLGLLFLTDLTGADVVLGKLAASGLTPMVCLLGLVPSLSIFVAFGGLSFAEFARTALALGVGTFQIMAVTLLVSSFSIRARAAAAAGLVFLGVGFAAVAAAGTPWVPILQWAPLVWGGPWALWHGSTYSNPADWVAYWIAIPGALAFGCLALWVASHALSKNWRKTSTPSVPAAQSSWEAKGPLLGVKWPESGMGAVAQLFQARSGAFGCGAFLGFFVFVFFSACAALMSVGTGGTWVIMAGVKVAALCSLALRGAQSLWQERRDGTLETLLATPMTPLEIVQGFSLGLRQMFVPALVMCGTLDGLAMAVCLWSKDMETLAVVGLSAASFWLSYWGLSWGSVWAGVCHERMIGGVLASLFCAVGAPALTAAWVGVGLFVARGLGSWVVLLVASGVVNLIWVSSLRHQAAKHGMAVMLRPWRQSAPVIESEWSPINWQAEAATRPDA